MKKSISIFLCLLMIAGILAGCTASPERGDKLSIVTTIFPEYDWVREILGDNSENAELTMLLGNGVDLHSYQPTVDDIVKISTCDMFIYVGGESESWVDSALKEAVNKDMKVINLLDVLGDSVKTEEIVEGMQQEAEHEHGDSASESEHLEEATNHGREEEADEHVWLSLKNAKALCAHIAAQLSTIDTANADAYAANAETYIERLSSLDAQYQAAADGGAKDTILFGDRFPFRYLTDDYALAYYAAFAGCSAETEASFETVAFLAGKVDELSLPCVLTIEGTAHKIAETIVDNTAEKNQQVLTMNSMQTITHDDVASGITYISIMEDNLEVLKTALN
ncbi:MAG: metal ABC transporter substrate-binding protein [Clostridia bacterium]|nr:metal ABC transporter substrate-binding protein [Clostridia bacterium]